MDYLSIMRNLQYVIILIGWLVALFIYFRFGFNGYMVILLLYITGILIITITRLLLPGESAAKVYYLSAIFHFFPLAIFFLKIDQPVIRDSKTTVFSSIWLLLLCVLMVNNNYTNWMLIGAFSNTGLFILAGYYYYKLFSTANPINIFSNSGFWVVTGIFICKSISLPMIAFYYFLESRNILDNVTFKNVFSIGSVGYIIMHLFFIKAFLCLVPQKAV